MIRLAQTLLLLVLYLSVALSSTYDKEKSFHIEQANTDVIDDFEAMVRRGRSQKVLHAVWLYDEDEECRKLVDESPEYSVYAHEVLRKMDDGLSCYGEDYARAVVPELAEEPLGLVEEALAQMPEEKAKGYQNEFDRLRFSGKDRKVDYYALYGKMVRDEVRGRYEVQKKLISAVTSELKDFTSIIPWHTYLTQVEKQEMQHNRKLSDHQKHTIYNQWCKKIKEEQRRKQVEIETYKKKLKKKREKAALISLSSLTATVLLLIIIRKRTIIYRRIQPLLRPYPLTICALLLIALFKLPYGYYQFLRIAVTIWALIVLIQTYHRPGESPGKTCTMLLSGGIAILYNPILPIRLDKEAWTVLNLLSIPLILLSTYLPPPKTATKALTPDHTGENNP